MGENRTKTGQQDCLVSGHLLTDDYHPQAILLLDANTSLSTTWSGWPWGHSWRMWTCADGWMPKILSYDCEYQGVPTKIPSTQLTCCWWFRSPAKQVEGGTLPTICDRFYTSQVVIAGVFSSTLARWEVLPWIFLGNTSTSIVDCLAMFEYLNLTLTRHSDGLRLRKGSNTGWLEKSTMVWLRH